MHMEDTGPALYLIHRRTGETVTGYCWARHILASCNDISHRLHIVDVMPACIGQYQVTVVTNPQSHALTHSTSTEQHSIQSTGWVKEVQHCNSIIKAVANPATSIHHVQTELMRSPMKCAGFVGV